MPLRRWRRQTMAIYQGGNTAKTRLILQYSLGYKPYYQPSPSGLESAFCEGRSMRLSKHSNRDSGLVCTDPYKTDSYKQETFMKKAIIPESAAGSARDWKVLFEAALVEDNPDMFAVRLQNARDAIVDEIEGSFETASSTDRRLLLAALNTISGLYEADSERLRSSRPIGHSA